MLPSFPSPQFGALICHDTRRRCPQTGVRILRYELTNDTGNGIMPLGRVTCPETGKPDKDHTAVAVLSRSLPQLAKLEPEDRLEVMRHLIREDSHNWKIGKNHPQDEKDECLADRGKVLLKDSTADIVRHPNGTYSMIMDYDRDLRGKSRESGPRFQAWA